VGNESRFMRGFAIIASLILWDDFTISQNAG
jgi:hypothetical protein